LRGAHGCIWCPAFRDNRAYRGRVVSLQGTRVGV
jgi:hypothetical protein